MGNLAQLNYTLQIVMSNLVLRNMDFKLTCGLVGYLIFIRPICDMSIPFFLSWAFGSLLFLHICTYIHQIRTIPYLFPISLQNEHQETHLNFHSTMTMLSPTITKEVCDTKIEFYDENYNEALNLAKASVSHHPNSALVRCHLKL